MNAIEKAKEISMGLAEDFADWMGPSWPMCGAQNAINKLAEMAEKRMIAALEAEKPAEDAFHAAKELTGKIGRVEIDLFKANELPGIDGKTFAGFSSKVIAEILLIFQEDIQSFAESYHAKKCAECKKIVPHKYQLFGQEDVQTT